MAEIKEYLPERRPFRTLAVVAASFGAVHLFLSLWFVVPDT